MSKLFDFYKRQITDFNRTEAELNAIIEELANNDGLTNDEYIQLYQKALEQIQK